MTEKKAPKSKAATAPKPADKAVEAAEVAAETKATPAVPGDDATADELAYFIRHNPVYATLPHEDRDALTRRLIEAARNA